MMNRKICLLLVSFAMLIGISSYAQITAPTDVAGCQLWLDGADPNGDGSLPVDGTALATWKDKSGANHDAAQSDANKQPVIKTGVLNSKAVVTFDGTDDNLSFTKMSDIRTVFWVLSEENQTDLHFLLGDDAEYNFHRGAASIWDDVYSADGIKGGTTRVDRADFDGLHNNIPIQQYVIVSLAASDNLVASNVTDDRDLLRHWNGGIAEIIVYNQALSDTDIKAVEDYLYLKWYVSTLPGVKVTGGTNHVDIPKGDASPTVGKGTDFGTVLTGSNPVVNTFTITNTGTDDLVLSNSPAVSLTGDSAFTVSSQPSSSTITAGNSVDFSISFDASVDGSYDATVSFESNDIPNSPFTFNITGKVSSTNSPDMKISGNSIFIPNGSLPSAGNGTDFGAVNIGSTQSQTFTIENVGTSDLTFSNNPIVSILGSNDFTITSQPSSSTLQPSSSVTFVVEFSPATAQDSSADISINSNDPGSPYRFAIKGRGASSGIGPGNVNGCLLWLDASDPMADNSTPQFGAASVWKDKSTLGNDALQSSTNDQPVLMDNQLNGKPVFHFDGASQFFSFTKIEHAVSVFWVLRETDHNDVHFFLGDDTNFDFHRGPSSDGFIWDPAVSDNVKNGTTYLDDVSVDGFTTPFPADGNFHKLAIVAKGDNTASTLSSDRTFGRYWKGEIAEVAIFNRELSDADRNLVIAALNTKWFSTSIDPDISIKGRGIVITSGSTTTSTNDDTDYGDSNLGKDNIHEFTIANSGGGTLNISAIEISGTDSTEFIKQTPVPSSVPATSSDTFKIAFHPTSEGVKNATVTVITNDKDTPNYTFVISGNGKKFDLPEIVVKGNGNVIQKGDTVPQISNNTNFGSIKIVQGGANTITKTFTIENTGKSTLHLLDPVISFTSSTNNAFSVTTAPASELAPLASTTFEITFTPDTAGIGYSAIVNINSDDRYNNPYDFKINASTDSPDPTEEAIVVSGNGEVIPNDSSQIPNTTNGTDFGDIEIGKFLTHTFIIENTGLGDDLEIIKIESNDLSVLIGNTPSIIKKGENASFTIDINASGVPRSIDATVTITNSSRLDSAYIIKVKANIIQQIASNINVLYNGQSIPSGGVPTLDNGTDFGQQTLNNPLVKEFTIVNIGTSQLTLDDNPPLALTGSATFTIVEQPSGTAISPGSTATFKIQFLPILEPEETAVLSFANNVAGKSPYVINLKGSGTQGEVSANIEVLGKGILIANNDTTPALLDDTDFGTVNAGSKVEHVFTIENNSSKDLELTSNELVTISGLAVNQFSLTQAPDSLVKAGGSTDFAITYNPTVLGDSDVTVTIDNNTNHSNPFSFTLHGIGSNGTPVAYMRVLGNQKVIVSGSTQTSVSDNTDFEDVDLNKEKVFDFMVENSGNTTLIFNNDPAIEITGNNATSFSVVKKLKPVLAGETGTFSIKFSPLIIGEKTAVISISTNDAVRDPYTFTIRGMAVDPNEAPVIVLSGKGENIQNGSTTPDVLNGTDFGGASIGMTADQEFVIYNDSFATLLLDGNPSVAVSGTNASEFVVSSFPTATTVPAKSQTKFTLSFKPTSAGAKNATVTISAGTAGDFVFAVQGTTLSQPPVANPDSYNVPVGGSLVVPNPGLLSNDTDPNGAALIAEAVTQPTKGVLLLNDDGSFSYTPNAGASGTDSFTYKAATSSTESVPATVTIDIVPAGTGTPIAMNDSYSVSENAILNIPAVGVLGNDIDSSGNPLSVTLGAYNGTGQLSLNSDGSFSYAPATNFIGVDSFTYTVSNGAAVSNAATVSIDVTATGINTPPVALGDAYSMTLNTTLNISSPGVLANDVDADGDALTAEIVSNVPSGHLVFYADGSFAYTPETDFTGTVVFSYKAADGVEYSNVVSVSIAVNPVGVNNPPVAVADDNYITPKDETLVIPAPGVLDNDFDADGDPLTAILVGDVSHGTLTLNSDGSFSYTPASGYVGVDAFSYKANDGTADSNVVSAIIKIDPNALPGVTEGMLFDVNGASGKIAAMYIDPVKGKQKTLRIKSTSDGFIWNKAVTLYSKKDYSYSLHKGNPTANWIQANPISPVPCSIISSDNQELGKIAINPPVITSIERWDGSDFYRGIHENSAFVIKGRFFGSKIPRITLEYIDSKKNVRQIRLKIDKNDLLFSNYKGKVASSPMDPNTGISQIRAALPGKFIPGGKCWIVLVTKTGIGADMKTKGIPSFNVVFSNTPPVAHNDTFVLSGQKSYMLDVLANDFDAESDNVVIMPSGKTSDKGGKLKVLGSRIQYTPKGSGADSFTYTIDDGHGGQSSATVNIR